MANRRQFLRLSALSAAVVCAGCGTTGHPVATGGALTMTCPTPTPGSLSGLTGTFAGIQASALVDAYHRKDPTRYNWQWTSYLTNKAGNGGGCARYQLRARMPGEVWLFPSLIGQREQIALGDYGYCPPPVTPITLSAVGNTATSDGNGNSYVAPVKYVVFSSTCREGKPVAATGGTITFTTLAEPYTYDQTAYDGTNPGVLTATGETGQGLIEATLDNVTFGSGQSVSGSLVAPFCSTLGCPPPPSSWQCVS